MDDGEYELTCCDTMRTALTAHLLGPQYWEEAKRHYLAVSDIGHHSLSKTLIRWIDSELSVIAPLPSSQFDDEVGLRELIEQEKAGADPWTEPYSRGILIASNLARYRSPVTMHMWHSIKMLHDINALNSTWSEVVASVARVGPVHNMVDQHGILIPGLLAESEHADEGWVSIDIIEFYRGDFRVLGQKSGPLVPMVTAEDLDVAAALAFIDRQTRLSLSLDEIASNIENIRLNQKAFKPSWLGATPFGQSLFLADWLMKAFTSHDGLPSITDPLITGSAIDGWKPPAFVKSLSQIEGSYELPDGSEAKFGRSELVIRSIDVEKAIFRKFGLFQTMQYRIRDASFKIESSLTSDPFSQDAHCRHDDMQTGPGAWAAAFQKNFQYVADLFPVFERVKTVLGLFAVFSQARQDGVVLSARTQARLRKRVEGYAAAARRYPNPELSPKPYHNGGCQCVGGVSGRDSANIVKTQTHPLTERLPGINFVVTPKGRAVVVPTGAVKTPIPGGGPGLRFAEGSGGRWGSEEHGLGAFHQSTAEVWIFPAIGNHRERCYYKRKHGTIGQKVDPFTGKTVGPGHPYAHIYLDD